jgi:CO/xanthine dehydrogenase Mo-binding subunit
MPAAVISDAPRRIGAGDLFADPETRYEGRPKVTGQARYTADFAAPGMLWAAFTTSPYPHARIVSIDTDRAQEVPGVRAIITGAHTGPRRFGRRLFDWPVLAYDRALFIGDRVAAVAAETREAAEEAARLIEVEYEELPAILDLDDAVTDGAPILHPDKERYHFAGGTYRPQAHPNIQGSRRLTKGDDDLGPHFAAAYRVFEHSYETPRQHHAFIEPHATLVQIEPDGIVRVHSPCKSPYLLRERLSVVSGVPVEKIVVEPSFIGGDFGGKGITIDEFPCYFLAKATGRPVKAVMSYVDELQGVNTRHPARIRLRTGVDREGRFLVHEAQVDYDGGAYAAAKPGTYLVPGGDVGFASVAYQVPHVRIDVRTLYTNTVPAGNMRSPADVQTIFAWESHVDCIAQELGIDPLDLRIRNAMRDGDSALTGEAVHAPRAYEVLTALRRESGWGRPLPAGHGRGVGFTCRHTGGGKTSVVVRLTADATVEILTGVPDQGSGNATVIQRVAAATLGVRPERIRVVQGDTSRAPVDPGAGASRVTHIVGKATQNGASALREQLEALTGTAVSDERFDAIAARACARGPLEVVGTFAGHEPDFSHPGDFSASAYAVEVEVDTETGAIRLHHVTFATEVATIINPVAHQGQIEGGYVFGLGGALMEELPVHDGKIATLSLGDYKVPTIADVPPLRTVHVEAAPASGPYGAKMAGELSNASLAPAIANAVADAVGVRLTTFPITAERIFAALNAAEVAS